MNEPAAESDGQPRPQKASGGGCLKGCAIATVILLVIGAVGAFVIYQNVGTWALDLASTGIDKALSESDLPDDQQTRIRARVAKLQTDYEEGRITSEQLVETTRELAESPLVPAAGVYFFQQKVVQPSGLAPEEKQMAERSLQRFARGVYERTIPSDKVEDVLLPVSRRKADGNLELKENPTDDEVRESVRRAHMHAEAAQVPDEPFQIDFADEFDRAVERGLSQKEGD
ncbi:MAG: hypothetical protein KC620_11130 [Myxococcales bacterium]|nr:hypothetical protein [Myxococcales bacterium]